MTDAKKVLITGATRGIGHAVSELLLTEGYEVIGLARSADSRFPGKLIQVDLLNAVKRREILASLFHDHQFYGVINNAGTNTLNLIEDVTDQDYRRIMELNLDIPFEICRHALPSMKHYREGRVVNISSRAMLGRARASVYASAKSGLIGLTRSLALEGAEFGVTVNAIAPGPIGTEMFHSNNPETSDETKRLMSRVPMNRIGESEEVAFAVSYFMNKKAAFTTGQTLFVCGGMSL